MMKPLRRGAAACALALACVVPQVAAADAANGCGSLDSARAIVARLGGALAPASQAQAEFLRAALIGEPGVDARALYDGETLLAALADGGAAAVVAVDGEACAMTIFPPGDAAILARIGRDPAARVGRAL